MTEEKAIVYLYAFRYAVGRIPTQALYDIQGELMENLEQLPEWVLKQMERDIEWNFTLMENIKECGHEISHSEDCSFQRPLLEAIKKRRKELKEDNKCQQ